MSAQERAVTIVEHIITRHKNTVECNNNIAVL